MLRLEEEQRELEEFRRAEALGRQLDREEGSGEKLCRRCCFMLLIVLISGSPSISQTA